MPPFRQQRRPWITRYSKRKPNPFPCLNPSILPFQPQSLKTAFLTRNAVRVNCKSVALQSIQSIAISKNTPKVSPIISSLSCLAQRDANSCALVRVVYPMSLRRRIWDKKSPMYKKKRFVCGFAYGWVTKKSHGYSRELDWQQRPASFENWSLRVND